MHTRGYVTEKEPQTYFFTNELLTYIKAVWQTWHCPQVEFSQVLWLPSDRAETWISGFKRRCAISKIKEALRLWSTLSLYILLNYLLLLFLIILLLTVFLALLWTCFGKNSSATQGLVLSSSNSDCFHQSCSHNLRLWSGNIHFISTKLLYYSLRTLPNISSKSYDLFKQWNPFSLMRFFVSRAHSFICFL